MDPLGIEKDICRTRFRPQKNGPTDGPTMWNQYTPLSTSLKPGYNNSKKINHRCTKQVTLEFRFAFTYFYPWVKRVLTSQQLCLYKRQSDMILALYDLTNFMNYIPLDQFRMFPRLNHTSHCNVSDVDVSTNQAYKHAKLLHFWKS